MIIQNPVERHIQSVDNQANANLLAQDLLSSAWWGMASLATCTIRNMMSNSLCPDSTPLWEMENKVTDFSKSLLLSFGQPVVCARLGNRKKSQHVPRNEFGIVVMPAHKLNGTYMVYLPEHGHFFVAPRFNVTPFYMGEGAKFTLEDGKQLLATLGTDGAWH